jgi:FAD synthase
MRPLFLSANEFLQYLRDDYGCTELFGGSDFSFGRGREGVLNDEKAEGMFYACHFKRIPYLRIHKTNEL